MATSFDVELAGASESVADLLRSPVIAWRQQVPLRLRSAAAIAGDKGGDAAGLARFNHARLLWKQHTPSRMGTVHDPVDVPRGIDRTDCRGNQAVMNGVNLEVVQ